MTKEYRRERKVKGYFILLVHHAKMFCQTDIQNNFSFTKKAAHEAKTSKNSFASEEAKLC